MERVIVMVVDAAEERRGEVTVLDEPAEAARLVESLLEAGYDQSGIRVFGANEIRMTVAHRPVVTLVPREPEAPQEAEPEPASEDREAGAEQAGEGELEASSEEEAPFVQNGVRFSSLFRPS
jgi:hypothetical protein